MKVTRRDFKFFFFGVLTVLLVEVIFNWGDFKKGFNDGWNMRSPTEVNP